MLMNKFSVRAALALVLPIVLMVPLFLLTWVLGHLFPPAAEVLSLASLIICSGIGFAWLITISDDITNWARLSVRPKLRRYTVALGLLYFPMMIALLFYFQLVLAGLIFGDSI